MDSFAGIRVSRAVTFACWNFLSFLSSKTIKIPAGKCDSYIYAYVANESTLPVLGSGHHLSPGGGGVGVEDFGGGSHGFQENRVGYRP